MNKVLGTILNAICIIIIVASLGMLFSVVTTPDGQPPQILGFSGFRVITGSMEPAIPVNSFVLVKHCEPGDVKAGDVISFYSSDATIGGSVNTHRVIAVGEENGSIYFTTQGDANPIPDRYPVYPSALIGRVIFVSNFFGTLIRLVSNPLIFGVFIALPLLAIIIVNVRGVKRDIKEIMEEVEEEENSGAAQAGEEETSGAEKGGEDEKSEAEKAREADIERMQAEVESLRLEAEKAEAENSGTAPEAEEE
jgi:signal peptidase I